MGKRVDALLAATTHRSTVFGFLRLALHRSGGANLPAAPGPRFRRTHPPFSPRHLAAYRAHVGDLGPPAEVPAHLFPAWCFALSGDLLGRLPLPMTRALNVGFSVESVQPLPAHEPLEVEGWLAEVERTETRALIRQRFVTSTGSAPGALRTEIRLLVRLGSRRGSPRAAVAVPAEAELVASEAVGRWAGLEYAALTGDFNPLHWWPAYARRAGFSAVLLHGFATAARTWAALERSKQRRIVGGEGRFLRPLVLPADLKVLKTEGEAYATDRRDAEPCFVFAYRTDEFFSNRAVSTGRR